MLTDSHRSQARRAVAGTGHTDLVNRITTRSANPGSKRTCAATLTRVYLNSTDPDVYLAVNQALGQLSGAYSVSSCTSGCVSVYRAADPAQA